MTTALIITRSEVKSFFNIISSLPRHLCDSKILTYF
nr:MAG TPA: hypothetical protein [Caudoviricetes sp.]DAM02703.1 MAG TPA: hypothetical protein [Caudoviricetes sp.]